MKRPLGPIVVLLVCAGCRAPAPPSDPFLYRSTVPPPGTMTGPVVTPGTPYYNGAPSSTPPLISPGTSVAPGGAMPGPTTTAPPTSPAPMGTPAPTTTPAPMATPFTPPATTPGPTDRLAPQGGFNFQGSTAPAKTDPAVAPASNLQAASPAAASPTSGDGSVVRIVEPTTATTASASPASASSTPAATVSATLPAAARPVSADQAQAMPATISDAALFATALPAPTTSSGTAATPVSAAAPLQQSTQRPVIGDITDLPEHLDPAAAASRPAAAQASQAPAANPQPQVFAPGDRSGVSYGYDPDYKTLRGKLEYVVSARRWRLRYMPTDGALDVYGGSVILSDSGQLNGFEPGDFVVAQGYLSSPTAGGGSLAPLFALQRIARQ